jgi:hypothetical protein
MYQGPGGCIIKSTRSIISWSWSVWSVWSIEAHGSGLKSIYTGPIRQALNHNYKMSTALSVCSLTAPSHWTSLSIISSFAQMTQQGIHSLFILKMTPISWKSSELRQCCITWLSLISLLITFSFCATLLCISWIIHNPIHKYLCRCR